MIKSRLYAKQKIGRMPGIMSLNDAELHNLLIEVSLEADDIAYFLEGHDLGLIDFADIEDCHIDVLLEGLKKHYDVTRENRGQDGAILMWQFNGGFEPDANALSRLVSGQKIDFRQVKAIPENELKSCLIKYLEMLASEQHH